MTPITPMTPMTPGTGTADPVVVVENLTVRARSGATVLDGVSMAVRESESLGLVGESGSGKTTLGHALLGYVRPGLEHLLRPARPGRRAEPGHADRRPDPGDTAGPCPGPRC